MFNLWKGSGTAVEKSSPLESFGKLRVARSLGEEILKENSTRRNCLQAIRDCLTSMSRGQKDDLVDRIFARLALFVFDLPASEASHHSERFGLLDHLLEVAHETAKVLTGPGFQVSPEASIHHREGPLWAYAGVIAAIAHDIGKPLDLDLVAPGSSTHWDPRKEPLRLFCERHELSQTSRELWHFHRGRGMSGHERHTLTLLPMVMTPEVEDYLGPRLPSVLRALSPTENWNTALDLSRTAQEVVKVVRRVDKQTATRDQQARHPRELENARVTSAPGVEIAATVRSIPAPVAAPVGAPVSRERAAAPVPSFQETQLDLLPIPRLLPPEFFPTKIPKPGKRRGDPVETAQRTEHQLRPDRFLDSLRRLVVAKRLARNGLYSHAYLTPEYVWLLVPEAFEVFARLYHVPFDRETVSRMNESLRRSPVVLPASGEFVTEFIKTRPDTPPLEAVRLRTRDFLKDEELASLGVHEFEIKVWSAQGAWEAPRLAAK